MSRVQIKKNKLTGKEWQIDVPIYWSYGIDDIGSCIDFLVREGVWAMAGSRVDAKDFELKEYKEKLAGTIANDKKLYKRLRILVGRRWREIEDEIALDRPPRYGGDWNE